MPSAESPSLFSGVCFWLSSTLSASTRSSLSELLLRSGASASIDEDDAITNPTGTDQTALLSGDVLHRVTHIITDNWHFKERQRLPEHIEIVTPHWVTRSYDLQHRQEPRFYSPDPSKLLSGLCICTTEIPPRDSEWVWNIVALLGGQYRSALTKEVTHLLAGKEAGSKWQMATTHGKSLGMRIVLPQWLYDTFQSRTLQPTRVYAWPNPLLYTIVAGNPSAGSSKEAPEEEQQTLPQSATHQILGGFEPRLSMYDALPADHPALVTMVNLSQTASLPINNGADVLLNLSDSDVDQATLSGHQSFASGLRFYVASDTEMSPSVAQAITQRLMNAGAESIFVASTHSTPQSSKSFNFGETVITDFYEPTWEHHLLRADYVICKERSGWEYWLAAKESKPTGTLLWLLSIIVAAKLDSPLSNIFHYPHPKSPIEGFNERELTITNYTSTKRELLKRLIELMGGKVHGEMHRQTNYVIAARKDGRKVESAIRWEIPILNHKWLSECWIRWTLVDPVNFEPGRTFLPGVDYQCTMLSDLPQNAVDSWAASIKALKSKEEAMKFLTLARSEHLKAPASVPASLDLEDSESEAGEPNASATPRRVRPSNSTPALIENQLLSSSRRSPKKVSAQQSSPGVLGNGNTSARVTPTAATSSKPTKKGAENSPRASHLEVNDVGDESTLAGIGLSSVSSRRKAAIVGADKSKASALDMNKHELEKKRKRFSEADLVPGNSVAESSSTAKKRKSKAQQDSGDESTDVPVTSKNKPKSQTDPQTPASAKKPTATARKSVATAQSDDAASAAASPSGTVRFLQTGHHMSEDLIRQFEALGAKKVDDPLKCTHVVAEEIKRTVKFLSALSHGPPFVTEKWVKDSVKKGKILPPSPYELSDRAGEAKWDFDLADSLQRARRGPKIFEGCTFYFTPHTVPEKNVLKEIIRANGGIVSDAKPTRANMLPASRDKCLISSNEDRKIWNPFVQADGTMAVHEGENILQSVLRQEFNTRGGH